MTTEIFVNTFKSYLLQPNNILPNRNADDTETKEDYSANLPMIDSSIVDQLINDTGSVGFQQLMDTFKTELIEKSASLNRAFKSQSLDSLRKEAPLLARCMYDLWRHSAQ